MESQAKEAMDLGFNLMPSSAFHMDMEQAAQEVAATFNELCSLYAFRAVFGSNCVIHYRSPTYLSFLFFLLFFFPQFWKDSGKRPCHFCETFDKYAIPLSRFFPDLGRKNKKKQNK